MLNLVLSFFMVFWEKIPAFLKNKYVLTLLAFGGWMLFFDTDNIIDRVQTVMQLREMSEKEQYYISEIAITKQEMNELLTNKESLEKFAREKYYMKRPDEELFVIIEE